MEIRAMLFRDFGIDLPISGGSGNSINTPIIIHRDGIMNDYIGVEYAFLKYLGVGRGVTWKILGQNLIVQDGKTIEKIKIETVEESKETTIQQIENFYFDITECYK